MAVRRSRQRDVRRPKPAARGGGRGRTWRSIGLIFAVLLAIGGTAAAYYVRTTGGAEELRPGAAAGFNLLLVTLDTVRADHLGCYGYAAARTPNLDALAASGLRFAQAIAPAPLTTPSHATMMTGLVPPSHGVRDNGCRLADEQTTLAEILSARGYATAAFISSFTLESRYGLAQGFATYDDACAPGGRSLATRWPMNVRRQLLRMRAERLNDGLAEPVLRGFTILIRTFLMPHRGHCGRRAESATAKSLCGLVGRVRSCCGKRSYGGR